MNHPRDISLPDEIADLFRQAGAQGITLIPVKGDFGFGCWGFQGQKGAEGVEVFWDGKDRLLEVRRLVHGKWELDTVHPISKSSPIGLARELLLSKLSGLRDEKTST